MRNSSRHARHTAATLPSLLCRDLTIASADSHDGRRTKQLALTAPSRYAAWRGYAATYFAIVTMIPASAHFIWFGSEFHWAHAVSIASAARCGGFERVVLHHDQPLDMRPGWSMMTSYPNFESRELIPDEVFAKCGDRANALSTLFARLDKPAARANMVRAAILYSEGGVYLDTDTVTLAPLDKLREAGAFLGEERIVFPRRMLANRTLFSMARAGVLTTLRDVYRRLPDGWRAFRSIESMYPKAANNAVLASEPGHSLVARLLDGMIAMPEERRLVRYALGTHLLQETVESNIEPDVVVHPPEVFYPLGPELSEHWFRLGGAPALDQVLSDATRVVHWYASVRTKKHIPFISPSYVRQHEHEQLLSALMSPYAAPDSP